MLIKEKHKQKPPWDSFPNEFWVYELSANWSTAGELELLQHVSYSLCPVICASWKVMAQYNFTNLYLLIFSSITCMFILRNALGIYNPMLYIIITLKFEKVQRRHIHSRILQSLQTTGPWVTDWAEVLSLPISCTANVLLPQILITQTVLMYK